MKLSALITVVDNGDYLDRTIESIRGTCDEITILSLDENILLKNYANISVIQRDFEGDFSKLKNWG